MEESAQNLPFHLQPSIARNSDSDLSLDWGPDPGGPGQESNNVAELLSEMKGEAGDHVSMGEGMDTDCDDFQNLDPAFLHGMNLNSLVREFEMEANGGGSELGILALADDCLN